MKKGNLDIKKLREMMLLYPGKVWGVTSVKRRTGKSYISMLLAEELRKIRKEVLVVSFKELSKEKSYTLQGLDEALEFFGKSTQAEYLYINDLEHAEERILNERFVELIELCKKQYDYVILDMKAIEETGFTKLMCKMCEETLIVVTKDQADGIETGKCVKHLQEQGIHVSGLILNEYCRKKTILKM